MFAVCVPSVTVRPAGSVTGIARLLHLCWIDYGEIDYVIAGHSCDSACEDRRVVELECAGVGATRWYRLNSVFGKGARTSLTEQVVEGRLGSGARLPLTCAGLIRGPSAAKPAA
jgi:hypothetical protein